VRALVMELVEGPTLAERIAQGALSLEEALPSRNKSPKRWVCAEKRIIHRDHKPPTSKSCRRQGQSSRLRFGQALSDDSSLQDASRCRALHGGDESRRHSGHGRVRGRAGPRKPADRRADIWSFGVVLYEMLSGRQIFGGETASDSMAAVITREPDWTVLPAGVPSRVRELLRRCLVKDPRKRLQAIGDARIELEEADVAEVAPAAAPAIIERARSRRVR
jgi:serine/threonine-protein kinase